MVRLVAVWAMSFPNTALGPHLDFPHLAEDKTVKSREITTRRYELECQWLAATEKIVAPMKIRAQQATGANSS